MNYGINTDLVEEVIQLLPNLLISFNREFLSPSYLLIHDYKDAQMLAWSQDTDEVEHVWEDLKSDESSQIIGALYDNDQNSHEEQLRYFIKDSSNYPHEFLLKYLDIFEGISSDLHICALNRLVNGMTDNLYEKIFEVYNLGGWPCGWIGEFPAGKLVVYTPKEK